MAGPGGAPAIQIEAGDNDPNAAMSIGVDIAMPSDWPSAVPIAKAGRLNDVGVAPNGSASAMWVFDSPVSTVWADYEALLTAAAFSEVPDSRIAVQGMAGADWTGNGYTLSVLVSEDSDGTTLLSLTATVAE